MNFDVVMAPQTGPETMRQYVCRPREAVDAIANRQRAEGLARAWASVREKDRVWLSQRGCPTAFTNEGLLAHVQRQSALISAERLQLHYRCSEAEQKLAAYEKEIANAVARGTPAHLPRPRTLWALQDDSQYHTVFGSLEDALADRAANDEDTAIVTPCCIAMPTIDAEWILDSLRASGHASWPADFGIDDHEGPFGGPCSSLVEVTEDVELAHAELTDLLSAAFATWVHRRVGFAERGKASVQAWNFTGPARRFEVYVKMQLGSAQVGQVTIAGGWTWIECCWKCERPLAKHGAPCEACDV